MRRPTYSLEQIKTICANKPTKLELKNLNEIVEEDYKCYSSREIILISFILIAATSFAEINRRNS